MRIFKIGKEILLPSQINKMKLVSADISESNMAFARHNIEKKRLIELVQLNPILWDCRLPQYKRSDKKKAVKWNEIGRLFSVNGERVQRTFTSLREIFRREFNHEKMLGSRFKSKWEYYDAMSFLKEVIRERKPRERSKRSTDLHQQNHSNSTAIDEYQYFAPNDPNNPNNQQNQQEQQQQLQQALEQSLQKVQAENTFDIIQQLRIQPDVIINLNTNTLTTVLQKDPLKSFQTQQLSQQSNQIQQQRQHQENRLSPQIVLTSCSTSSTPSIYIKDEPDSQDETISLTSTNNDKPIKSLSKNSKSKSIENENELEMDSSSHNFKTKRFYNTANIDDDDDILTNNNDEDDPDVDLIDERLSIASTTSFARHQPTAREILYTKFGDFLAARLNTLNETVANDLMNKILLLIAEK